MRTVLRILSCTILLISTIFYGQKDNTPSADWQRTNPGFRALAITSSGDVFWVTGTGESIASSPDGQSWKVSHHADIGGASLIGIQFPTSSFGFAFGTGGTLLTTTDGGATWQSHHLADSPILLASFADPEHGIFRTSSSLYYVDGASPPHPISEPKDTLKRFPYVPFLSALSPEKMAAVLSEGPYSEAGYLSTVDAGKSWQFYDPPSTGIRDLLSVGDSYWTTGHEVVGKDKPGGGNGVPMAMSSQDGVHWSRTPNDIRACRWEYCALCTTKGCLASGNLLVNFFEGSTTYHTIPNGPLTGKWATSGGRICTIHGGELACASLGAAHEILAQPKTPQPSASIFPKLGTPAPTGVLRCMSCSLQPVYVDDQVQGQFELMLTFKVAADGTIDTAAIENAPNESLRQKLLTEIQGWLFEPPTQEGRPVAVATHTKIRINVLKPR